jgi:cell shape-determining protein MreC
LYKKRNQLTMFDNILYSIFKWKATSTVNNIKKDFTGEPKSEPNKVESFISSIQDKVEDYQSERERKKFLAAKRKEREAAQRKREKERAKAKK